MKNLILLLLFILLPGVSLQSQGYMTLVDTFVIEPNTLVSGGAEIIESSDGTLFYGLFDHGKGVNALYQIAENGSLIEKTIPDFAIQDFLYVQDDESYFIVGDRNPSAITISHIDADHQVIWTKNYTETFITGVRRNLVEGVILLEDGFLVYGSKDSRHINSILPNTCIPFMFRVNFAGDLIWELTLENANSTFSNLDRFCQESDSGFQIANEPNFDTIAFLVGEKWPTIDNELPSLDPEGVVGSKYSIDTDGNIISISDYSVFTQKYFLEKYDHIDVVAFRETIHSIRKVESGEIYYGSVEVIEEFYDEIKEEYVYVYITDLFLFKIDKETGERVWIRSNDDISRGYTHVLPNGNILYLPIDSRQEVQEIDVESGEIIKEQNMFPASISEFKITDYFVRDDHILCFAKPFIQPPPPKIIAIKVDFNLNAYDFQSTIIPYYGFDNPFLSEIIELSNGDFAGIRQTTSELYNNAISNIVVFRANKDGVIYSNSIEGQVLGDLNNDCLEDPNDVNLQDWIVRATKEGMSFQSTTDENGNYKLQLDTGAYTVNTISPNDFWLDCDTAAVEFTNFFDTLSNIDLITSAIIPCSFLEVDVGFGGLRRCFSNRVKVQYCNRGSSAEEQAMVELHLDPYLDVGNTSIPITSQEDTTYFFDIGEVGIGECGEFTIHVTPNCDDAVLGQEHCINAHVFPDTICIPPDSLWTGANVVIEAICLGDSTLFNLINMGGFATKDDLEYIVIVDDIIVSRTDVYSLAAGDTLSFIEYEPGSTVTVIADQEPFHPAGKQIGIEAFCAGTDFDFISAFNQFDDDPFTDIVCRPNVGSYDPNDKAALPEGSGPEHFISANQELEYKIRFQNTGTDTAFTVVIRDTISSLLDMSTFETGIGSHDYVLDIEEENILVFTFNDILLPDSTVNWTASNGFVEFRISPVGTVVPDDRIENTAAIFFDFNEPVITNTVFHTIETPVVFSIKNVDICADELYEEVLYEKDTTFSTLYATPFLDSFAITELHILSVDSTEEFNIVPSGTLIDEILLTADTTIYETFTNTLGCDSILIRNFQIENTTAVSLIDETHWDIFPNPATEILTIRTKQSLCEEAYTVRLFSILGTTVYETNHKILPNTDLNLNLRDLPSGTYMLNISSKHGMLTEKIVINP